VPALVGSHLDGATALDESVENAGPLLGDVVALVALEPIEEPLGSVKTFAVPERPDVPVPWIVRSPRRTERQPGTETGTRR